MNFWILILLLFTSPGLSLAEDAPNFVVEGERFSVQQSGGYNAGMYDRELTESEMLQIIQERRYEYSKDYVLEYQKLTYWVFLVENRNPHPTRVFARFPLRAKLTKVWLKTGEQLQAFTRYPGVFDIFYIDIPPGRSTLIGTRYAGGSVRGSASSTLLEDFTSSVRHATIKQHVMGSVCGAVAIMILYNLGMYLFFRRIYFLYYTIYSLASIYCIAIFNGYVPWVLPHLAVGLSISGIGLVFFINSSLSLRSTHLWLYRASLALIAYIATTNTVVWFHPQWNYVAFSMPVVLLFFIYVSVRRTLDGYRPAVYLLIGWCALLLTSILSVVNVAYLGSSYLTDAVSFGFAIEVCFFSFAIGQKVRISEQRALRESEHAFNQLKKVFYPHQINQIKGGMELERTMPTGRGEAAVICFDIVESSRIQQPKAKAFIENSIKSCVSIISENYNPTLLRANGYRIKEVGDGFLCSVGYPFEQPQGVNSAQCAVELSLRFIRIFQDQVNQMLDHAPVYCSIGIALDYLEGYFPQVGTIEYDVYGRAVILATRYEGFRRQLFPQGVQGHILTLHEKVYEQLPLELKQGFQEVDLHRSHLVVRDDLGACKLYYQVIQPVDVRKHEQAAS